jgi:hypothetical protein
MWQRRRSDGDHDWLVVTGVAALELDELDVPEDELDVPEDELPELVVAELVVVAVDATAALWVVAAAACLAAARLAAVAFLAAARLAAAFLAAAPSLAVVDTCADWDTAAVVLVVPCADRAGSLPLASWT